MLDTDQHSSDAIAALWHDHGQRLVRFAGAVVGPHDAHDIASEVFFDVASELLDGRVEHPNAFLYRAVSNRARNMRRSRQRQWRRDLYAVPHRHIDAPDSFVEVRHAVASLSVSQRAVVFLVYWEDRTERDVADMLQISPGTVRRHLVRARVHLRKALQ
jgi:RNA polymerase sigma-70 factor (ECF subfamily)